jgi:hypothetical protein
MALAYLATHLPVAPLLKLFIYVIVENDFLLLLAPEVQSCILLLHIRSFCSIRACLGSVSGRIGAPMLVACSPSDPLSTPAGS